MKIISFLRLFLIVMIISSCGPTIYKTADFESKTAKHKIVAILPAEVTISLRPNEMKNMSIESFKEKEAATGFSIQNNLYSWFLRRSEKFKYTVSFEDISKRNALLAKAGIEYKDLKYKTKEELATILQVDAVISTRVSMQKPMSEGAALAIGVLIGTWGATNTVQTSINIHEAKKGELIWKYDYKASGSVGNNAENLVNGLMRNASKKFPYNDK